MGVVVGLLRGMWRWGPPFQSIVLFSLELVGSQSAAGSAGLKRRSFVFRNSPTKDYAWSPTVKGEGGSFPAWFEDLARQCGDGEIVSYQLLDDCTVKFLTEEHEPGSGEKKSRWMWSIEQNYLKPIPELLADFERDAPQKPGAQWREKVSAGEKASAETAGAVISDEKDKESEGRYDRFFEVPRCSSFARRDAFLFTLMLNGGRNYT